jgi:ABC-type branched-subunit amino acid transport system ATPase component
MFLSAVGWSGGGHRLDHRWVVTGSDELFDVSLRISRTFPNVRLFTAMSVFENVISRRGTTR